MIRARKSRTDDNELVRLVRTELIPMSYTTRPHDAHTIGEIPKQFRRGVTYVATRSKFGPPVAFVHFEVIEATLSVDMLVTHPEHRGFRFGTTLMAHAEAYGRAHHCHIVRLLIDRINTRAQHFYHKLGYQTVQFYPDLQCYELQKPLAPSSASNYC
ncbi:GNAT family N-acetyltransferase [Paenibacillus sp. L3-i20]|uniref:GNAT family N-acetyltransferase n=1 Tax=Paenibacillus sp. L3-i20 TaxID=2905833 RepID=UPI001EE01638|nr:GNAT family N-acetyltransferase [Paenibacillus sp. L3-i20]GKU75909.1 hypothetical protein L3i20_v203060 [Paenibacillus sp. L3-i20]